MTRDERGTSYDGEEHIKIMEPIIEYMTNNIMKAFEFLLNDHFFTFVRISTFD